MSSHASGIVRITANVHAAIFPRVLQSLRDNGVNLTCTLHGRMPLLSDARGLQGLFLSGGLSDIPLGSIQFFVPHDREILALGLVIHAGKLTVPGRGSVYSEHLKLLPGASLPVSLSNPEANTVSAEALEEATDALHSHLMLLGSYVPGSSTDSLSRSLLHVGVVPTITLAQGMGLRDRLGLLRITMPRDKDFVTLVAGRAEADFITEKIIEDARLGSPGRGFTFQSPVHKGLINIKTSDQQAGHAASIDQIVAAIDTLKKNTAWRQGASGIHWIQRRSYLSGSNVFLYLRAALSGALVLRAMKHGISGASIFSPRLHLLQSAHDGPHETRELCSMFVPEQMLPSIAQWCEDLDLADNDPYFLAAHTGVHKAFAYVRPID